MHGRVRLSDGSPQMNIEMGLPTSLARHGVKGETSKSCDEAVHNNTAGARCCYMLTVNCICRTAARCYMYGCAVGRCTVQLCSIAIPLDVRKAGPSTSGDSAGDGSSVHSSTVRSPYPDTTAPSSLSAARAWGGRAGRLLPAPGGVTVRPEVCFTSFVCVVAALPNTYSWTSNLLYMYRLSDK